MPLHHSASRTRQFLFVCVSVGLSDGFLMAVLNVFGLSAFIKDIYFFSCVLELVGS